MSEPIPPEVISALTAVRDKLAAGLIPPEKFYMGDFGERCDSPHCIGGLVAVELRRRHGTYDKAVTWLWGLTKKHDELHRLFYPHNRGGTRRPYSDITQAQAIAAIDQVLAGKVPVWEERS